MRLVADGLTAERGGEPVLAGITFSLAQGDAMTVTGANGSGKSTLLRVIAGLLPPTAGSVRLDGVAGDFSTPAAASHYLGHQNGMKPALSVEENLAFWRSYLGHAHCAVEEALDLVGLGGVGPLPFATLSTGQRRRVAIARLLVSWRPIWLLDEPTAGLDASSERQVGALIDAHREEGGIVVAATHLELGIEGQRLELGDAG